jgi:hypothetical protein
MPRPRDEYVNDRRGHFRQPLEHQLSRRLVQSAQDLDPITNPLQHFALMGPIRAFVGGDPSRSHAWMNSSMAASSSPQIRLQTWCHSSAARRSASLKPAAFNWSRRLTGRPKITGDSLSAAQLLQPRLLDGLLGAGGGGRQAALDVLAGLDGVAGLCRRHWDPHWRGSCDDDIHTGVATRTDDLRDKPISDGASG